MGSTPPMSRLTLYGFRDRRLEASSPRTKCARPEGDRSVSFRIEYSCAFRWMYSANWTVAVVASVSLGCLSFGCVRFPALQLSAAHHRSHLVSYIPVSPASPENASSVFLFSDLVLSSDAFRTVAPRMAALDAAMSVKSLPVIPNSTSLRGVRIAASSFSHRP